MFGSGESVSVPGKLPICFLARYGLRGRLPRGPPIQKESVLGRNQAMALPCIWICTFRDPARTICVTLLVVDLEERGCLDSESPVWRP